MIKKVIKKENFLLICFQIYQSDENLVVVVVKVVVLFGKYGNWKGFRVGGLLLGLKDLKELQEEINLFVKDFDRLWIIINFNFDVVFVFQNEVVRMMFEGVDVFEFNMDVE